MDYVERGWTKEEIMEAIRLLKSGQSCIFFKGATWDWRMLKMAVEEELARPREKTEV